MSCSAFNPALCCSSLGSGGAWWGNHFPTWVSWVTFYWTVIFIQERANLLSVCLGEFSLTGLLHVPKSRNKTVPISHNPLTPFQSPPLPSRGQLPSEPLTAQISFSGFVLYTNGITRHPLSRVCSFCSLSCLWHWSLSLHAVAVCSFLCLCSIPLWDYTKIYFSVLSLMSIWMVSHFCLLWRVLFLKLLCMSSGNHTSTLLLMYLGGKLLGHCLYEFSFSRKCQR